MAYQSRTRKRVLAVRRGPDGSAFQKCLGCGVYVAIALVDMHEFEARENVKKLKRNHFEDVVVEEQINTKSDNTNLEKSNYPEFQDMGFGKHKFQDQPRSAFCFFMEEFMEKYKNGNQIEIDRMGFETWKKMSFEERLPYVHQEYKVNNAYTNALHKEEHEFSYVDEEVDSSTAGMFSKGKTAANKKSINMQNNLLVNFLWLHGCKPPI